MRYVVSLIILVAGFIALLYWSIHYPGVTFISWGTHSTYGKTAAFALYLALIFLVLHWVLNALGGSFNLRKRLRRSKQARTLTKGLVQLTEGNWEKAEKLLASHVEYSQTPFVSYIAAARAAHMQEAYDRRDEYLRQAIEQDPKSRFAVGVSQADMQLGTNQLEQAYATLQNLQHLKPHHPYVIKLLARTLYRRESWDELMDLLPELLKHNILKTEDMQNIEIATLTGLFKKQIKEGGSAKLQLMWERLPAIVKAHPEAIALYAQMLHEAQDDTACEQFIHKHLAQHWQDELAELYGTIAHRNIKASLKTAQQWSAEQGNNPAMLLMMARLYKQQQAGELAKQYYEASVNQEPNAEAYLELAELLEQLGERDNAQLCYQTGLRFSITQKGERLVLIDSD